LSINQHIILNNISSCIFRTPDQSDDEAILGQQV